MKGIIVEKHGGPEVLKYKEIASDKPGPGQVKVRNYAIGLNYTDVYFRTGMYLPEKLPFVPGNEGAGEVIAVGKNVTDVEVGDRVAYVTLLGAYADEALVPAQYIVPLPDSISYEIGAAVILKGLTAEYLLRRTFKVQKNHIILIHAAAGGVGSILTQWARHIGATVIGTVGSDKKAILAKDNGCDYVINYTKENIAMRVKEITNNEGCHVVYDGVGQATYAASLESLRNRGYFVNFGSASGAIDAFDFASLAQHGSLFATSPVLFDYLDSREMVLAMGRNLFSAIESNIIKPQTPVRISLEEASLAHQMLESRETTGATILIP